VTVKLHTRNERKVGPTFHERVFAEKPVSIFTLRYSRLRNRLHLLHTPNPFHPPSDKETLADLEPIMTRKSQGSRKCYFADFRDETPRILGRAVIIVNSFPTANLNHYAPVNPQRKGNPQLCLPPS